MLLFSAVDYYLRGYLITFLNETDLIETLLFGTRLTMLTPFLFVTFAYMFIYIKLSFY